MTDSQGVGVWGVLLGLAMFVLSPYIARWQHDHYGVPLAGGIVFGRALGALMGIAGVIIWTGLVT